MSSLTYATDEIIFNLVNYANGTTLDATIVTLGSVTALTDDPTGKNTSVVATPLAGSGYKTAETLTYDRLDMTTLLSKLDKTLVVSSYTQTSDLLDAFNAAFELLLSSSDIVNDTLTGAGTAQAITLTLASDCPAFTGSVVLQVNPS